MSDRSAQMTEVSLEEWLSGRDAGFEAGSRERVRDRVMAHVPGYAAPLHSARLLFRRSATAFAVTATMLSGVSYAAARSGPGDLLYPVRMAAIQVREALRGDYESTGGKAPEDRPGSSAATSSTVVPVHEQTQERIRLREHREFREATSEQSRTGDETDGPSGSGTGPHGSDGSGGSAGSAGSGATDGGSGSSGGGSEGSRQGTGGGQNATPGQNTGQSQDGTGSGSGGSGDGQAGQGDSPGGDGAQDPGGPSGDGVSPDQQDQQQQRNNDRDQGGQGALP